jgi:hypothetical protein
VGAPKRLDVFESTLRVPNGVEFGAFLTPMSGALNFSGHNFPFAFWTAP